MAREVANGILTYKKNLALATSDFQDPQITENEIEKAIEETEEKHYEGVLFKVQLAASSKKTELTPGNFKGLKELSSNLEDGLHKYYYGETSDYNKIQLMKTYARERGYASAYIVAFKNGEKVKVSEVLATQED